MIVHRAAWVLPMAAPPIRDGWVAIDRGCITATGAAPCPEHLRRFEAGNHPDRRVILPGLVNAHVHLELSWMRGEVPPAASMPAWASQLMAVRRARESDPVAPLRDAIDQARSFGTALVGDVTNTLASYAGLLETQMRGAVFFEQLGFRTTEPRGRAAEAAAKVKALQPTSRLRAYVAPHAPYSLSPDFLHAIGELGAPIVEIHLGESREEVEFLRDGTGAWREVLESLGVWDDRWVAPGCGPVEYLARVGLLDSRLLAVHGVQLTDEELGKLAEVGATLVTCPRSNLWTGAGAAPIARFYRSGVRVAVGTDSLASVDDLNIFAELAAMRAAAPDVKASRLLESATRAGAEALGFGAELGTIDSGKHGALIAVRLPGGVEDVEEYLVGGIEAGDIEWLDAD
ncbi:MAG: amidohydrolase family protein [Vicinamibacterales bacterium]